MKARAQPCVLERRLLGLWFQDRSQQPPGFAEAFEARSFFAAVGIEPQVFAGREGLDREHVPEIERHDVGDDAIDVVGGKCDHFALLVDVGMDGVAAMALIGGGTERSLDKLGISAAGSRLRSRPQDAST